MLEIKYNLTGEILKINEFWLRDHCRCNECHNTETHQRRYNLLDICENVQPLELSYSDDELHVSWNDGHDSKYKLDFIYQAQQRQLISRRTKSTARTCWSRETLLLHKQLLHFKLADIVSSDVVVKDFVSTLVRYGIVFIESVPPTTTMTEMAVRRVFPVMKTFFGEMYTFSDHQDHADTAYTKLYLGSHTDNTYFCDAAGLQALHCIEHVNGGGGENFFVDGLHCAEVLRAQNPNAFKVLSTVHVPAEYIEAGQHHTHSAPIIRIDPITGEIVQLRFNMYDRAVFDSIPQTEMSTFYASLREFIEIVQRPEQQWSLKLQPGTIAIFDNWRTFHGRHSYTGQRTMTGCYVQRTDYLSMARTLGIID